MYGNTNENRIAGGSQSWRIAAAANTIKNFSSIVASNIDTEVTVLEEVVRDNDPASGTYGQLITVDVLAEQNLVGRLLQPGDILTPRHHFSRIVADKDMMGYLLLSLNEINRI